MFTFHLHYLCKLWIASSNICVCLYNDKQLHMLELKTIFMLFTTIIKEAPWLGLCQRNSVSFRSFPKTARRRKSNVYRDMSSKMLFYVRPITPSFLLSLVPSFSSHSSLVRPNCLWLLPVNDEAFHPFFFLPSAFLSIIHLLTHLFLAPCCFLFSCFSFLNLPLFSLFWLISYCFLCMQYFLPSSFTLLSYVYALPTFYLPLVHLP